MFFPRGPISHLLLQTSKTGLIVRWSMGTINARRPEENEVLMRLGVTSVIHVITR